MTVDDLIDQLTEIRRAGQGALEVVDDEDHPLIDIEVSLDEPKAVVTSFASYTVGE